ncbi:MAG: LysR family transcriptional regulator [Deltaproteobacteria bacterium]|nr:LysR family transcriptional regulator [Deltaproteobacteria bacterium]
MELDLNQLRAFMEAVRAESYTLAARKLHVSQSAVSHAIRKLETSADKRLVAWRGRRFSLTEDGRALYETCERVFFELDDAQKRLTSKGSKTAHRAVLGATVEFGTTVLIRKMTPFLRAHPEIHVDFLFSHDLIPPLLHDEVDLAVDCRLHRHPSMERIDLFREKYAVIVAPAFARKHKIRKPRDLADLPVLSLDADAEWWGNLLRALPAAERPAFRRVVAVNHIRGIINAAIDGLGVGFVPKYTVLGELGGKNLVELFGDLPLLEDTFRVYQKRSRAASEVNRLLTAHLLAIDTSEFGDAMGSVS